MAEDLHDLVRQLKAELEWALRVGVEPAEAPRKVVVRDVAPYDPGAEARAAPPSVELEPESPPTPTAPALGPSPIESSPSSPPALDADARAAIRAAPTLAVVRDVLGDCTRCGLHAGRRQIVFGVGNEQAEIMFIGEGPGADEDRRGEPFVGKAGQLLTRIIENGMGMSRSDVYIANIVKCRPPNNRDPQPDEVEACEPFLAAQIRVIAPKVIITLGKYASQTLLRTSTPITRLRGTWSEYLGTPVMPTYHPAYLLRNPAEKRPVWEDIQEVLKWLGRPLPR
jgi:DNA polymerase